MIEWPVEPGSAGPISVNSMGTNDNTPTGIGLVYTAAEVKSYPYRNTAFSGSFCCTPPFFLSYCLAEIQLDHFFYEEKLIQYSVQYTYSS